MAGVATGETVNIAKESRAIHLSGGETGLFAVEGMENIETPGGLIDQYKAKVLEAIYSTPEEKKLKFIVPMNGGLVPFIYAMQAIKDKGGEMATSLFDHLGQRDQAGNFVNIVFAGKPPDDTEERDGEYELSSVIDPNNDHVIVLDDIADQCKAYRDILWTIYKRSLQSSLSLSSVNPYQRRDILQTWYQMQEGDMSSYQMVTMTTKQDSLTQNLGGYDPRMNSIHPAMAIQNLASGEAPWIRFGAGMNAGDQKVSSLSPGERQIYFRRTALQRLSKTVGYSGASNLDLAVELNLLEQNLIALAQDGALADGEMGLVDFLTRLEATRYSKNGSVEGQFVLVKRWMNEKLVPSLSA